MKISSIILAALMCLPILASAVPDSVITGPYNVSFDLGLPHDAYQVTVSDPKEKESLGGDKTINYVINIKNLTGLSRLASFTLNQGEIGTLLTPDEMQVGLRSILSNTAGLKNVDVAEREIDGKQGAIGSGDLYVSGLNIKMYQASYYPFTDTVVFISSAYPWDEGTLSLLKTIHVEKINATS